MSAPPVDLRSAMLIPKVVLKTLGRLMCRSATAAWKTAPKETLIGEIPHHEISRMQLNQSAQALTSDASSARQRCRARRCYRSI
jgi:hypothetical protein